ncbi:MAG TPA: abortive infection family protein [Terriglobales bacterium]
MRSVIPGAVIGVVSEVVIEFETHASMNSLFMYAGAPGEEPEGNKQVKAQQWLRAANKDPLVQPLEVLGKVIERIMDDPTPGETMQAGRRRIVEVLERCNLSYSMGGVVTGAAGVPSRSLHQIIQARDLKSVDEEFTRAVKNLTSNPREAVSAACNILESVCKTYIEDEKLDMPAKQDLAGLWMVVRKHLNFDPSKVADQDLQKILSGMMSVVDGIGALRTHVSSAHGAGRTRYALEARHARLAVNGAHTVVTFILESWDRRKSASPLRS